jgi:hypothetical protein
MFQGCRSNFAGRPEVGFALRISEFSSDSLRLSLPMNRWYDRQVLECGSPLPLWRSWVIESARGLAQSKTLTRHWRFMALMRVHCWRSELPMNRDNFLPRDVRSRRGRRRSARFRGSKREPWLGKISLTPPLIRGDAENSGESKRAGFSSGPQTENKALFQVNSLKLSVSGAADLRLTSHTVLRFCVPTTVTS